MLASRQNFGELGCNIVTPFPMKCEVVKDECHFTVAHWYHFRLFFPVFSFTQLFFLVFPFTQNYFFLSADYFPVYTELFFRFRRFFFGFSLYAELFFLSADFSSRFSVYAELFFRFRRFVPFFGLHKLFSAYLNFFFCLFKLFSCFFKHFVSVINRNYGVLTLVRPWSRSQRDFEFFPFTTKQTVNSYISALAQVRKL